MRWSRRRREPIIASGDAYVRGESHQCWLRQLIIKPMAEPVVWASLRSSLLIGKVNPQETQCSTRTYNIYSAHAHPLPCQDATVSDGNFCGFAITESSYLLHSKYAKPSNLFLFTFTSKAFMDDGAKPFITYGDDKTIRLVWSNAQPSTGMFLRCTWNDFDWFYRQSIGVFLKQKATPG